MKIRTGNCNSCKNKQSTYFDENGYGATYCGEKKPSDDFIMIREGGTSVLGDWYVGCLSGFKETIAKFYIDNGHKTSEENKVITMECYEREPGLIMLDNCLEAAQDLLDHLKNKDNDPL